MRREGFEATYAAAEAWKVRCLSGGRSLFTDSGEAWTEPHLRDFYDRMIGNPDGGGEAFLTKLEGQLSGAADETILLAAECLYVYYLINGKTGAKHKRQAVGKVLALMSEPVQIPAELDACFEGGPSSPGTYFLLNPYLEVGYILKFAIAVRGLDEGARALTLGDPWKFLSLAQSAQDKGQSPQKNALLHLVFPDTFESMVADVHKDKVIREFGHLISKLDPEWDRAIIQIREALTPEHGEGFDFYSSKVAALWLEKHPYAWVFQANPARYDIRGAAHALPQIAFSVNQGRKQIKKGDRVAFWESGAAGGVVALGTVMDGPGQVAPLPGEERFAKDEGLLAEKHGVTVRIDRALDPIIGRDYARQDSELTGMEVLSFSNGTNYRLMPDEWERIVELSGRKDVTPPDSQELAEPFSTIFTSYQEAWDFFDFARDQLKTLGLADGKDPRIAAGIFERGRKMSVVYGNCLVAGMYAPGVQPYRLSTVLTRSGAEIAQDSELLYRFKQEPSDDPVILMGLPAPVSESPWSSEVEASNAEALVRLGSWFSHWKRSNFVRSHMPVLSEALFVDDVRRRLLAEGIAKDEPVVPPTPVSAGSDLTELSAKLLLEPIDYLDDVADLLEAKKQIIFYGPPGTGKTYVARELARELAGGNEDAVQLVQFHPSYAYEDFVEGYRPTLQDGVAGFELRPGPLRSIAEQALGNPEQTYILIIDEINRGNVAKVFGELYFLLEYRNESVGLQYSQDSFQLPSNLYVIGTMNTADRSIAMVDAALRRRFHFVPFRPNEAPIKGLLGRWLGQNKPDLTWVADVVDAANEILGADNIAIGPSHFMRGELDDRWVNLIWKHSILPSVEEQLVDRPQRVREFELDSIRAKLAGASAGAVLDEYDDEPPVSA